MTDLPQHIIDEQPLIKFSIYTTAQAQSLDLIGKEIIGLSEGWTSHITDFQRVYSLFWLWVLGAYEVVRVMSQYEHCFTQKQQHNISQQKRLLAEIRMPFAKQQMRGKDLPVHAELSVHGIENGMVFEISGQKYSSNAVIEEFLMFIDNIESDDILDSLPVRRPQGA